MADQVVGDLAQMFGGQDRVGELVERLGVDTFDGLDEVVEADGMGDLSRGLPSSTLS